MTFDDLIRISPTLAKVERMAEDVARCRLHRAPETRAAIWGEQVRPLLLQMVGPDAAFAVPALSEPHALEVAEAHLLCVIRGVPVEDSACRCIQCRRPVGDGRALSAGR